MKTRIFISCGQAKNTSELDVAQDIVSRLKNDFDCYVAVNEQTVLGLRENIFEQLRRSEYFLFIDFRREVTSRSHWFSLLKSLIPQSRVHRGSLFTHQELAISSFLELGTIAFHERGINERDGMRGAMQLNSEVFDDRGTLAERIEAVVRSKWHPGWKNGLNIEESPIVPVDAHEGSETGPMIRHYHLAVRNHHRTKIAEECRVFLVEETNVHTGVTKSYEAVEVKWGGSIIPSIPILPEHFRRFDAFQIAHAQPATMIFKGFCDSTEFRPKIKQPGVYRFTYHLVSSNFPSIRKTIEVNLTGSLGTVTVKAL